MKAVIFFFRQCYWSPINQYQSNQGKYYSNNWGYLFYNCQTREHPGCQRDPHLKIYQINNTVYLPKGTSCKTSILSKYVCRLDQKIFAVNRPKYCDCLHYILNSIFFWSYQNLSKDWDFQFVSSNKNQMGFPIIIIIIFTSFKPIDSLRIKAEKIEIGTVHCTSKHTCIKWVLESTCIGNILWKESSKL